MSARRSGCSARSRPRTGPASTRKTAPPPSSPTLKVVEALQFWVDLLSKVHGIHSPGIQEWGTTPADFLEGRIAMIWTTTGNLANIKKNATFDFGVAPYPGKVAPASVLGGGNFYIFAKAPQAEKEAAFKFVKFMTSDELLADWCIQTGYVAPRDGAWDTPALKKYVDETPAAIVARKQIASSVPEFSTIRTPAPPSC